MSKIKLLPYKLDDTDCDLNDPDSLSDTVYEVFSYLNVSTEYLIRQFGDEYPVDRFRMVDNFLQFKIEFTSAGKTLLEIWDSIAVILPDDDTMMMEMFPFNLNLDDYDYVANEIRNIVTKFENGNLSATEKYQNSIDSEGFGDCILRPEFIQRNRHDRWKIVSK